MYSQSLILFIRLFLGNSQEIGRKECFCFVFSDTLNLNPVSHLDIGHTLCMCRRECLKFQPAQTNMPHYKLMHFNIPGPAALIGFIFAEAGEDFEDIIIDHQSAAWTQLKDSQSLASLYYRLHVFFLRWHWIHHASLLGLYTGLVYSSIAAAGSEVTLVTWSILLRSGFSTAD